MQTFLLKLAALIALFFVVNTANAQLKINEALASNTTGITNESGLFEDWIEIYNPGATAVNLAGYYLSDVPANPVLFQFPATDAAKTTVPANGYLVIWCDNSPLLGPHHATLKLGASGETLRLTAPDGTTMVDQIIFGAQTANISYGRFPNGGTTFTTFTTPTPGAANIASTPAPQPTITNLFINEIAAVGTIFADEEGKFEDWVELYNAGTTSLDIGGLYLTDDLGAMQKWQIPTGTTIPAGGFYYFWTDEEILQGPRHTNFSLKKGGEKVIIVQNVAAGNAIVDSVSFPAQLFQASYGRTTNGGTPWKLFGLPTFNASNNGGLSFLPEPVISLPSAKYSGTQTITITHPTAGAVIRYTTDGSMPSVTSPIYTGPITITNTTTLRARAFLNSYEPSQPTDAAYLFDVTSNLPVFYLTTDPKNLYDDSIGIYTDGTNGIQQNCAQYPVNWAQDWERPCNYKMFLPDGTMAFDVNGGIQIDGVCSRSFKLKSLGIDLKEKVYGDEKISYKLFPQRSYSSFEKLKLRNSGQDYQRTGFRDMVNHQLVLGKMDIEAQAGRPVLVYINGTFHGIQNVREKTSKEFFGIAYGVNEDSIDIIKSPGVPWNEIKEGNFTTYNALHAYMETADMNNDAQFAYFQQNVDMEEFMNYWISMIYMANGDWPSNNLLVWREQKPAAKWRYCMTDTDVSTGSAFGNLDRAHFNTLQLCSDANSTVWPNHQGSTLFLRKLLARPSFRDEFAQRTCSFANLVFNSERANLQIDSAKNAYQPHVQAQLDLYGSDLALGGSTTLWSAFVDSFKVFYQQRPDFMREHIRAAYNLAGTYTLTVNFNAASGGDVQANWTKMALPYNYQGLYFQGIPLRLTAVAKPGFTFSHWLENGSTNPVLEFSTDNNAATLTPIFTPTGTADCPTLGLNIGAPCNDNNPNTIGTTVQPNCTCGGGTTSAVTITCPVDVNVVTATGNTSANVTYSIPTASTTCGTSGTTITRTSGLSSGSAFPLGSTQVCYTAADNCTNTKSCCFTINVTSGPSANPCNDVVVTGTNNTISIQNLLMPNVGVQVFSLPSYIKPFGCFGSECNTPTINVPNLAEGNYIVKVDFYSTTWQFICSKDIPVTVTSGGGSTGVLTLNCPSNITLTAAQGATSTAVSYTAPIGTSTCTTGSVTTTKTSGINSGAAFPIGTSEVCYAASDGCNNNKTCCFNVTVNASTPQPSVVNITCPADIVVTPPTGATTMAVSYTIPTATTTCANTSLNNTHTAGLASGSSFPIGTSQVCYTAADNCNSTKSCCFNVTVNSPATGNACDAVTITGTNSTISIQNITAPNIGLQVFSLPSYGNIFTCIGGSCTTPTLNVPNLPAGLYRVKLDLYSSTWQFICSKDMNITVTTGGGGTTTAVNITCPASITVAATTGTSAAVVNYALPTASTNCTTGSVTLTRISGFASGTSFPVGTSTVCYQAQDGCGNTKTCCFTITVNANTNPTDPCAAISASTSSGAVSINNLPTDRIVQITVYNAQTFAQVGSCSNNCNTPTQTYSGLSAGNYVAKVKIFQLTAAGGWTFICKKDISFTISSNLSNGSSAQPVTYLEQTTMYPNPATHEVYIVGNPENAPDTEAILSINDMYGRELIRQNINFNLTPKAQISLQGLTEGMYTVRIGYENQRSVVKMLSVIR